MSSLAQIRKKRLVKMESLKEKGMNPYPIKTERTHTIEEALLDFDRLQSSKKAVSLVGRIRSIREHGGSTFLNFEDGSGVIQAYFKKDKLGIDKYRLFLDYFDIGDIIEVLGTLFQTRRGEKTIEASSFKMLSKALLPLPEKWHGLQDIEERFRKRYLDLIMNKEVKEKFRLRSLIVRELRHILDNSGFLEVETPILQPIPGGAVAKPFKTRLNALKLDLYLRVAPELYLKRLLVGGFEKIYEIGRCFRNEGMDKHHNPDFTMLELYWAYQHRDGLMSFVEGLISDLVRRVKGGTKIIYEGKRIDFKPPWKRIKYSKSFESTKGKIVQPTFVVDHPLEISLLAKAKPSAKTGGVVADRFQLIAGGIELMNGFSELNNPIEQKERFEKAKLAPERRDKDFIEALEYGMPPAAGLGMGIDRLVILLTDSHSLREAILFPTMRPRLR